MNFRRRLRQRCLTKRCLVEKCKSTASRFIDVGPERKWLCALHFELEKSAGAEGASIMRCATCNADLEKEECSHVRGDVRAPSAGALVAI